LATTAAGGVGFLAGNGVYVLETAGGDAELVIELVLKVAGPGGRDTAFAWRSAFTVAGRSRLGDGESGSQRQLRARVPLGAGMRDMAAVLMT
jgi:hypothetical protein